MARNRCSHRRHAADATSAARSPATVRGRGVFDRQTPRPAPDSAWKENRPRYQTALDDAFALRFDPAWIFETCTDLVFGRRTRFPKARTTQTLANCPSCAVGAKSTSRASCCNRFHASLLSNCESGRMDRQCRISIVEIQSVWLCRSGMDSLQNLRRCSRRTPARNWGATTRGATSSTLPHRRILSIVRLLCGSPFPFRASSFQIWKSGLRPLPKTR